jgi:hypothetical protein
VGRRAFWAIRKWIGQLLESSSASAPASASKRPTGASGRFRPPNWPTRKRTPIICCPCAIAWRPNSRQPGYWEEADEIFREQTRVRLPDKAFDPDGFWSINGAFDLSPEKQAALRGLYLFRDREAKRRDIPPFKILGERTLLELADKMPTRE